MKLSIKGVELVNEMGLDLTNGEKQAEDAQCFDHFRNYIMEGSKCLICWNIGLPEN